MQLPQPFFEQHIIAKKLSFWLLILLPVAVVTGLMVALFLWLLDTVTIIRWEHIYLIYLLPLVGVAIVWMYQKAGKNVEKGNNLLIDAVHDTQKGVPGRMMPLILISTLLTHLFGGSAGREGTAVQMGGSIGAKFAALFKLPHPQKKLLLLCGMSAGFGAVFGTPVAGTIFALEVLAVGKIKYDALFPCLASGLIAHLVCIACGIHHSSYTVNTHLFNNWHQITLLQGGIILVKIFLAGIIFGFCAWIFSQLSELVKSTSKTYIKQPLLIPLIGGIIVLSLVYVLDSYDYLGLGVTNPNNGVSLNSTFQINGVGSFSWLWKLLFTVITLSTGFKGGEVTPLFFIGAALGNTLSGIMGIPTDLMAALGFIAVFAGATNTPLASTIMGVELFGGNNVLFYAIVCFMAYYFSGHTGIYTAQRKAGSKIHL